MLKIRFGESALGVCDVMLKDMADSKRIDDRIQGDISVSTLVEPDRQNVADGLDHRSPACRVKDVLAKSRIVGTTPRPQAGEVSTSVHSELV